MHVPDMSYTSSCLNVNAMSQTWSYTSSKITRMSWHEFSIYFLRFKWEFYYLNIHHTYSLPQTSNLCYINSNTYNNNVVVLFTYNLP
ncbi:hypothetical protein F383_33215 [Gossypium arboreum]|uniref:Uncharacterized protein n=1 Tax=Gossypium arboreum TaxID=29729 RepID=A0A0B0N1F3_GOSAR|nr:hypothetical protein F383_33215 [Gossypium arboreum]